MLDHDDMHHAYVVFIYLNLCDDSFGEDGLQQLHGFCVIVGGSADKAIHPRCVFLGSHMNVDSSNQLLSPDRFAAGTLIV